LLRKERTMTAPAPAANPPAKEERGGDDAMETTAPTATKRRSRRRETSTGGTIGVMVFVLLRRLPRGRSGNVPCREVLSIIEKAKEEK
jgi:hypothetical protein